MSRLQRLARLAFGCLLLGITVLVSVLIYARSDDAAERLRRTVVRIGSAQLGADIYVQRLEVEQLLPPAVVLTEITLHDEVGMPLGHVAEVRLALDKLPLGKELAIRSLQITGPSVRLAVEGGKLRDFADLLKGPKAEGDGQGEPMKVQLGALQIDGAAARITLEPAGLAVAVAGVDLAFRQDAAGNGSGHLGAQTIDLSLGPLREKATLEPSNFTVESGVVTVGESALELASGRVEIGGVIGLPDPPGAPNARPMSYGLTARAAVELPQLRDVWPDLPRMDGRVDAALGLSGQGKQPLVTFNLQGQQMAVHLTKPRPMVLKGEDASLIGHFRDGHVVIEEESLLRWGGGTIKPQGWFDLREQMPFEVDLEIRGLRLEQALDSATVPGSWVTMGIGGTARLEGHAKNFAATGSGRLNVWDLVVGDRAWDDGVERTEMLRVPRATVTTGLSMTGKHLLMSPTTVRGPHGTDLDVSCDFLFLKPLGLVIDVRSRSFDTRDILDTVTGLNVQGLGQLAANIEGPSNDLGIRGEIELDDFTFLDWPFGRVGGDVVWHAREDLEFLSLRGRRGASDFESEVRVLFADTRLGGTRERLEVMIEARVPEGHGHAEDLLPIFFGDSIQASGPVHGSTQLAGIPNKLNGDAEVHGTDVAYLWETFSQVDIEAKVKEGVLHIEKGNASKPNGNALRVDGWLAPGGDLEFRFSLPGMELRQMDPVRALFPYAPSSDLVELAGGGGPWVDGRAAGEVEIEGNLKNIRLRGSLEVDDFIYRGTYLGDSALDLKITDHLFKTHGTLLGERIVAEAAVHTNKLFDYDYRLSWKDFSLTPYLPRTILAQREPVTAGMTGAITGEGTLKDDFHDVLLTLDEIWLERGRHRMENRADEPVLIAYSGGALRFQSVGLSSPPDGAGTTDLRVTGWLRPNGPLEIGIGGKVDVAFADLASDVFDRAEADLLAVQAQISGRSTRSVDIFGTALLEGALLKTIYWPHAFEIDTALIKLDEGLLSIEDFVGSMGGGQLENVTGSSMKLDRTGYRVRRYDLHADCVDCTFRYPSFMPPTTATAKLKFTGNAPDRLTLGGHVHITEMVLRDPLNWQRSVLTFQRRFTETLARTERPGLFDIDLVFDSDPGQVRIDNNVGEIAGTADGFRVRGDTQHVILEGGVELTSGTLPYQGHDFEVESGGVARFEDRESWFPRLEVRMTTQVVSRDETYEISYEVSGPLNALQLNASSEPHLTENDINLLLLFGLTQDQLADADVAELLAASAGTAAGAYGETAATSFGQNVRDNQVADLLLPDRVEIVPIYTETTGATTVWAVATKEIVPDLLTLEGGVGLFTTGQLQVPTVARAQLRFRREVYLEGSWLRDDAASTSLGNFGLDLKFEIDLD
ncbi:MAG: hypothetical protein GY898_11390 [Proteobacteria bacterium]|nr:hypothetical protein [Pseudomonadota bacterium]